MQKDSKKAKIEPVHIEEAAKLKALFKERAKVSQMRFGEDNELGSQVSRRGKDPGQSAVRPKP